jgi:8-oxo-dGTP diphosphatase
LSGDFSFQRITLEFWENCDKVILTNHNEEAGNILKKEMSIRREVDRMELKHCNCIVVFDKKKEKLLFCKRAKPPYMGLLNFVGGKLEPGESSEAAAYRELFEETGISRSDIELHRLMDMTYYQQKLVLEMYVGVLSGDVKLVEEINSLEWIDMDDDFADSSRYAGDKNIAHIVEVAKQFYRNSSDEKPALAEGLFAGVDGCKGGWIAAILRDRKLQLYKYGAFSELVHDNVHFDGMLVDMVIGLPGNLEQYKQRPDGVARRLIKPRTSTIFAVPARQAVYELTKEKQKKANVSVVGKGLSEQTIAIIPKMREIDEFLSDNRKYMNVIRESHPEVCFARLNGRVLLTNKSKRDGICDRVRVLSKFLPDLSEDFVRVSAKSLGCKPDDILDAICLAVTANLDSQGKTEVIPEVPSVDDKGLTMQMVIPKG